MNILIYKYNKNIIEESEIQIYTTSRDPYDCVSYLMHLLLWENHKNIDNFQISDIKKLCKNYSNIEGVVHNEHIRKYIQTLVEPLDEIYFWSGKYQKNFICYENIIVSKDQKLHALKQTGLKDEDINNILAVGQELVENLR